MYIQVLIANKPANFKQNYLKVTNMESTKIDSYCKNIFVELKESTIT